jgi:hypothetical protein
MMFVLSDSYAPGWNLVLAFRTCEAGRRRSPAQPPGQTLPKDTSLVEKALEPKRPSLVAKMCSLRALWMVCRRYVLYRLVKQELAVNRPEKTAGWTDGFYSVNLKQEWKRVHVAIVAVCSEHNG